MRKLILSSVFSEFSVAHFVRRSKYLVADREAHTFTKPISAGEKGDRVINSP